MMTDFVFWPNYPFKFIQDRVLEFIIRLLRQLIPHIEFIVHRFSVLNFKQS